MGMAEAKSRQEDFDAAITFIDLGINVAIEDLWMLYDKKGEIYILSKDWDLAKAAYENNIAMPDDQSKSEGYFGLGNMYHQKGDLQNAYLAWKEADKYFHTYANEYIEQHCQEILAAEIEANAAELIIDMQADFATNRASKVLQPLLHQLWKVDMKTTAAQNPMFAEIPPEMEKQILGLMSNICIGIEAEGMFVLNPGQSGVRLVYKIKEETTTNVSIFGIPLNGTEERTFVLTPKGNHLIFNGFGSEGADIDLYMEPTSSKKLSKAAQEALFKAKQGGKLDFMGDNFKELV
jgi:tetratricopeptide (TPR) repeat protein